MKKILLSLSLILSIATAAYCEDAISYKASAINFKHIAPDTLDVLIKKIGKDSVLKTLDLRIKNAAMFVKYGTNKLKDIIAAQELYAFNKHFKLNMESSFDFTNIPGKVFGDSTGSSIKLYGKRYGDTAEAVQQINLLNNSDRDANQTMMTYMYTPGGRLGLATYCDLIKKNISSALFDTLYKGALLYTNEIRNEFYFTITEFDKTCGNSDNASAYYRKQLYEKTVPIFSLTTALKDTTTLTALNYKKYKLNNRYKFLAYSLYAKDFDIKKHQEDVIYFLTSQDKLGGFREFNIISERPTIEPTIYGLWALLELKEQIKELY